MRQVSLNGTIKESLQEAYALIDEDLKEMEEIRKEMDRMLYDIERRISRLKSRRAE